MNEDTGTDVNWVSPKLVQACNLEVLKAPSNIGFLDFHGKEHRPVGLVKIPWAGKTTRTRQDEFFLAPDGFPADLIVGNKFIKTVGHSHTVFMDEPPPGKALIMMQKRITVGKGRLVIS